MTETKATTTDRRGTWEGGSPPLGSPPLTWPDCSFCKKSNAGDKICIKCYAASYCSKDCQVAHWTKEHKQACKPPALRYVPRSMVQYNDKNWLADNCTVSQTTASELKYMPELIDSLPRSRGETGYFLAQDGLSVFIARRKKPDWPEIALTPASATTCCDPVNLVSDVPYLRNGFIGPESLLKRINDDNKILGDLGKIKTVLDRLVIGMRESKDALRIDFVRENLKTICRVACPPLSGETKRTDVDPDSNNNNTENLACSKVKNLTGWKGSDFLTLVPHEPGRSLWSMTEANVPLGDQEFLVSEVSWDVAKRCPFQKKSDLVYYGFDHGSIDWVVQNCKTKERIHLPSLTVHMMLNHNGFCQGIHSKWRIDPAKLLRVLRGGPAALPLTPPAKQKPDAFLLSNSDYGFAGSSEMSVNFDGAGDAMMRLLHKKAGGSSDDTKQNAQESGTQTDKPLPGDSKTRDSRRGQGEGGSPPLPFTCYSILTSCMASATKEQTPGPLEPADNYAMALPDAKNGMMMAHAYRFAPCLKKVLPNYSSNRSVLLQARYCTKFHTNFSSVATSYKSTIATGAWILASVQRTGSDHLAFKLIDCRLCTKDDLKSHEQVAKCTAFHEFVTKTKRDWYIPVFVACNEDPRESVGLLFSLPWISGESLIVHSFLG